MRTHDLKPYGDNVILVVPVPAETMLHSEDKPFCYNSTCPCHQDRASRREVYRYVLQGLMSREDARLFLAGKTF